MGNLFATDSLENDVLKYDSTGTLLGGSGIIQAGLGGVPATFRPEGIAFIESVLDADGDSVNDDDDLCVRTSLVNAGLFLVKNGIYVTKKVLACPPMHDHLGNVRPPIEFAPCPFVVLNGFLRNKLSDFNGYLLYPYQPPKRRRYG